MNIRPIRTEMDYRFALREVSAYFDDEPELGSEDGDRFEILLTLIEAYEARHFPVDLPGPIEAIKFRMEQEGLTAKDLEPAIGKRNRVYEVLNGKRNLTLAMIWKLHEMFGIPAESLIKPPRQTDKATVSA
ncbi:helix-turn-helix domain-containing protein [Halomonas huangheensis]|uniref:Transcriptional regulator n=1 Tax=Halomonas huangheensis TaxID=1178482 RepID=W1N3L9_9GAMM|nr:helix-turn-helix domain-containing protein [Halomonas huangheensis]ALM52002.1 transcriptional regulator [Halomonas huangheensis]ERL49555.1 transcriptional regulator [Halomonas huangheensis]